MPRTINRTQLRSMSYSRAWLTFRRNRRLPSIPRVLVPAIRSDSNDNKTIHYTNRHQIICWGCVDRQNNVPQDVIIAPEANGMDWSSALGIHLVRYSHITPVNVPACRPGHDKINFWRINIRCDVCDLRTKSLNRFVKHWCTPKL